MPAERLDRARWLGHRWHRHGLADGVRPADDLFLLGYQGSGTAGDRQALRQRTARAGRRAVRDAVTPEGPLVSVWSVRGAPHAHLLGLLGVVRAVLAPRDTDDGGPAHAATVAAVAAVLTEVVTGPTPKGEASTAVTERLPQLAAWCPGCGVDHVPDGTFRVAGGQALLPVTLSEKGGAVLHPAPGHPAAPAGDPRGDLLAAFLRVNGPVTEVTYRDWLGGDTKAARGPWRDLDEGTGLVTVEVDGVKLKAPEEVLAAVREAPDAEGVALVPPHDPYLRQVDRARLVPDRTRRGEVWRAVSPPGALLVDGEVAGTWRYRRSEGRLTVRPFGPVSAARRRAVEARAELVAEASGADTPDVAWD